LTFSLRGQKGQSGRIPEGGLGRERVEKGVKVLTWIKASDIVVCPLLSVLPPLRLDICGVHCPRCQRCKPRDRASNGGNAHASDQSSRTLYHARVFHGVKVIATWYASNA